VPGVFLPSQVWITAGVATKSCATSRTKARYRNGQQGGRAEVAARAKVIAPSWHQRTDLTRQLAALGTSFNDVLDRLRNNLALKYVRESDLSLAEVAFLLGYANPPAFTLAFKRWTGKTPSQLRQA
jgi:AraC-like DNA-binding protein